MDLDEIMAAPMFDLRGPNGEVWTLRADGAVSGFPTGTVVVNHAAPLLAAMIGKMVKEGARVACASPL